jgi:hypothetical protein
MACQNMLFHFAIQQNGAVAPTLTLLHHDFYVKHESAEQSFIPVSRQQGNLTEREGSVRLTS